MARDVSWGVVTAGDPGEYRKHFVHIDGGKFVEAEAGRVHHGTGGRASGPPRGHERRDRATRLDDVKVRVR
jgi:hypothetical protein